MSLLDDVLERLGSLPSAERESVIQEAVKATKDMVWVPNPGPQTDAYNSEADVLLYGGEPGGGKSQLLLGLAFNRHRRSLLMRRKYSDLGRLVEDALKINGGKKGFNGAPPPKLRLEDDRQIDFGAAHRVGDEQDWMGKGRDFLGVDEATHFAESQIRFLMGWNRTEVAGQRVRTVLATNPPLSAEGMWVVAMFAPWLDPTFHDPAAPGELRWVVSDEDGKDRWVSGPDDTITIDGKVIRPTSRTYIPASVSDNPEYAHSDYERNLMAMPEPFRSLLMGGFKTSFQDAPNQIIPTAWVVEAQARWTPTPPSGVPMCAIGVDATGGGTDPMILAPRYDGYYAELIEVPAKEIPVERAGRTGAGVVVANRRDGATVIVDMGGGFGIPMYEHLKANDVEVFAYKGAGKSVRHTKEGNLKFFNIRSEAIWSFREALDPNQPGGSSIALPPDPRLVADLTAPRVDMNFNGIKAENKEDVCERLGRSTDRGDAVVMAWHAGAKALTDLQNWKEQNIGRRLGRTPQVLMRKPKGR